MNQLATVSHTLLVFSFWVRGGWVQGGVNFNDFRFIYMQVLAARYLIYLARVGDIKRYIPSLNNLHLILHTVCCRFWEVPTLISSTDVHTASCSLTSSMNILGITFLSDLFYLGCLILFALYRNFGNTFFATNVVHFSFNNRAVHVLRSCYIFKFLYLLFTLSQF